MNIQIMTTGKSFETQKAIRYFKERRISFQLIELGKKRKLSKGELASITKAVGMAGLVDYSCKDYSKHNIDYHGIDSEETRRIILENPQLLKTPIVRNGKQATVGYCPDIWAAWQ